MENKIKIAMLPFETKANKFIDLLKESFDKNKYEIVPFDDAYTDKNLFKQTEFFLLNWYESPVSDSFFSAVAKLLRKLQKLVRLQLAGKKIIWVMHNIEAHNRKYAFHSRIIINYLLKNAFRIIILSNESRNILKERRDYNKIEDKLVYVPHPNYIGAYRESSCAPEDGSINLLFIGAIQPYKNVDLLIKVYRECKLTGTTLTLAGKVSSDEYKQYLLGLIGNDPSIKTEFRFIEDNEMLDHIAMSDLLVLPYDKRSSLNSGTIILAFSNRRTVISPMIGTLKDFKNGEDYFGYDYQTDAEHEAALKNALLRAVSFSKEELLKKGENCYLEVEKNNSQETVGKQLDKIFAAGLDR